MPKNMNRYDFIYLYEAKDANPNGDPDAGNLPRVDTETGHGLVTDVCLKRKIRDYVHLTGKARIYVHARAVLNTLNNDAWDAILPATKKGDRKNRPKDEQKARELTSWMCANYFDVRTFGAVMSHEVNCGQVRGPVQIAFSRSVDPIVSLEHAISICAARKEDKAVDDQIGIQGRKFTIPYGLYRAHGFINPFLAAQTGFSDEDRELFFNALENAFQFDQSAARPAGSMNPRGLLIFEHASQLGNAPSHQLFESVTIRRKAGVDAPRSFADYDIFVDESAIPEGVTLIRRI